MIFIKYKIFAGLSGGFGGANYIETFDCDDEEEATEIAYYHACDEYESYAGLYGLRDIEEIMNEDIVEESEAEEIYRDERESWLDYYVELDNAESDSQDNN